MRPTNFPPRRAHLRQSLHVRWANIGDVPSSLLLHAPQIREPISSPLASYARRVFQFKYCNKQDAQATCGMRF